LTILMENCPHFCGTVGFLCRSGHAGSSGKPGSSWSFFCAAAVCWDDRASIVAEVVSQRRHIVVEVSGSPRLRSVGANLPMLGSAGSLFSLDVVADRGGPCGLRLKAAHLVMPDAEAWQGCGPGKRTWEGIEPSETTRLARSRRVLRPFNHVLSAGSSRPGSLPARQLRKAQHEDPVVLRVHGTAVGPCAAVYHGSLTRRWFSWQCLGKEGANTNLSV
jgi:hypothetical protein